MKIKNVVTVINDRQEYTEFLPLFRLAWKKMYNIDPLVGVINGNYSEDLSPYCFFPRDFNIDSGIQAKISRMFLATQLTGCTMVVDIDMIPVDNGFFNVIRDVNDGQLIQWGYDHPAYSIYINRGKWPMDKTCAHQKTWLKIVNPNNLTYEDWIKSLYGITENMCNIKNSFSNFSDESLLKYLLDKSGHTDICKIERSKYNNKQYKGNLYGRLDRNEILNNYNIEDYFEVHGPRPYSQYRDWYSGIEVFLDKI